MKCIEMGQEKQSLTGPLSALKVSLSSKMVPKHSTTVPLMGVVAVEEELRLKSISISSVLETLIYRCESLHHVLK